MNVLLVFITDQTYASSNMCKFPFYIMHHLFLIEFYDKKGSSFFFMYNFNQCKGFTFFNKNKIKIFQARIVRFVCKPNYDCLIVCALWKTHIS